MLLLGNVAHERVEYILIHLAAKEKARKGVSSQDYEEHTEEPIEARGARDYP